MSEQALYKSALAKWGEDSQIKMLLEEMAELQKALCKFGRKPCAETLINVQEEIADVEIMLGQMRVIFCDSGPDLIKAKKLKRLEAMLTDEPRGEEGRG